MDGQRFDAMTKAVGRAATRRQVLRLAGGGLAGAMLAAVGQGRLAGAKGAGGEKPDWAFCAINDGPLFNSPHSGGEPSDHDGRPCPGSFYCPQDRICISIMNPVGRYLCRCVEL